MPLILGTWISLNQLPNLLLTRLSYPNLNHLFAGILIASPVAGFLSVPYSIYINQEEKESSIQVERRKNIANRLIMHEHFRTKW